MLVTLASFGTWWAPTAVADDTSSWMERLAERGIDPVLAVQCAPLGEALVTSPKWLKTLNLNSPPVTQAFRERMASAQGRERFGFDNEGILRVASDQSSTQHFSIEMSYAGQPEDVGELLSVMSGKQPMELEWQDGVLMSVDGEALPPQLRLALQDAQLKLQSHEVGPRGPRAVVRERMAQAPRPDGSCVALLDAGGLAPGEMGEGFLIADFPMQATGTVTADLYLEKVPALPVVESWKAGPMLASSSVPMMVVTVGSTEMLSAMASFVPPLADLPLEPFDAMTVAMFENEEVIVAFPLPPELVEDRRRLKQTLAELSTMEGTKVKKRGRNLFTVGDMFATVVDGTLTLSSTKPLALELQTREGPPWLTEAEVALTEDYPVLLHVRSAASEVQVPVTIAFRGASDHVDAALQVDDIEGFLAAMTAARAQ